jgi:hypothetical protein
VVTLSCGLTTWRSFDDAKKDVVHVGIEAGMVKICTTITCNKADSADHIIFHWISLLAKSLFCGPVRISCSVPQLSRLFPERVLLQGIGSHPRPGSMDNSDQ